jgi:hypothetical protein
MSTTLETPSARLITRPFLVAVVMLASAAVLAGPVGSWLQFRLDKAPLPLRNPLAAMDVDAIRPYRVVGRLTLEPNVVEALGTSQFLHWTLEDTSVPPSDPLRRATLFITYYTGGRDLVPHVPDECMLGAGYQAFGNHENKDVTLPALVQEFASVPVRVCTFMRTAIHNSAKMTVVYTFAVNGSFAATRTDVRLRTADPRNRHAYFSKIEVSFPGATRAQSVSGARKLFDTVLPVLLRDHYPDFEQAEKASDEQS